MAKQLTEDQISKLEPTVVQHYLAGEVNITEEMWKHLHQFTPAMQRTICKQVLDGKWRGIDEILQEQYGYPMRWVGRKDAS